MGNDDLWDASVKHTRGRARSAVMNDSGGVLEELIVGHFFDHLDFVRMSKGWKLRPAPLEDDFASSRPCSDKTLHVRPGIFIHHAAKRNDRYPLSLRESAQGYFHRGALRCLPPAVTYKVEAILQMGIWTS